MKTALALALALLAPSLAAAQPLVLVVDPGPADLDARALRRAIADALGRDVVPLADPRAASARDSLALASDDGARWVLRYDAGGRGAWRTELAARENRLRSLAAASRRLVAIAWAHETGDLLDPFGGWDPLRDALGRELMQPFVRRVRLAEGGVVDPFAPPHATVDLLDPWR